ncbi:putative ribosomal protein eS26-like [Cynocephalus volans]|uniref:putative ribosomal protein eS26-like n=1 Tax=Cynocephalus volans TaxID=110931 RepID=UPI002FC87BA3
MTKERRNNHHTKKGHGHVQTIHCKNCAQCVPRTRPLKSLSFGAEATAIRNTSEVNIFNTYVLPKLYLKVRYCVSCITHSKVVRNCSHEAQKD